MTLLIASSILILILGTLFVPLRIVLSSSDDKYYINLWGYFKAQLIQSGSSWQVRVRLFLIPISFSAGRKRKKKKNDGVQLEKPKAKKRRISFLQVADMIANILKSIKVDRLHASIDTGNYPVNAQLIPLTQAFQSDNMRININFFNYNSIDFQASTYAYKILWTLIKTYLFTNNSNHGK